MNSIEQVYQYLKACSYYMLATVEGTQPRVRPFGTVLLYEGRLYIQTLHRKRTAQQLALNPKAEICAMSSDGQSWIRVCGTLVDDHRVAPKKAMLDNYPFLRGEYDEHDPETAVYYFTHATAWLSQEGKEDVELHF